MPATLLQLMRDHPVEAFVAVGLASWILHSAVRPDLG